MKIKELVKSRLVTIEKGDDLRLAAKTLAADEIGALLVINGAGVVGMWSERDLARAVADSVDLDRTQVGAYMTEAPISVQADGAIGQAIAKMNEFDVRHLLVVDEQGPLGVISMRDVFHLLGSAWPEL